MRPYTAYALVIAGYWTLFGAFVALILRSSKPITQLFSWVDLATLSLATFRLSRMATYDRVTTVLRLPFVDPDKGPVQPEGTRGMPRGSGLRLAIGQLFT